MIHTENKTPARKLRRILLASTMICSLAAPALAGGDEDQNEGPSRAELAARIDRLENRLDRILNRLEADEAVLTRDEAVSVRQASKVISEMPLSTPTPSAASSSSSVPIVPAADPTQRMAAAELDTPGGVSSQQTDPPTSNKISFKTGDTEFTFKGYVKLDTAITDFSGGELPSSSIGRDFYIPALIPVGGEGDGADFDFNPRETRFIFAVDTVRGGHDIGGLIEFDFQVTDGGNERVSNSFIPRMRQAYITIDNWLFGQAWSTFQDVGALPDSVDFIGPTEGTVFSRQAMIRYTKGPFQFAIEQPETEVTGPDGSRLLPGDDFAPDAVLRYNYKRDWGHLTLAGIGRTLNVEEDVVAGAQADTVFGYGVSASGKVKLGERDDFRFMATYGDGIGRYVGVNLVNDVAVGADGQLETIATYSGFLSYRHFWSPVLRSSVTGGYFKADNPVALVGDGVTDEVYSIRTNLIYTVAKNLDVGIEYSHASRELESGIDGEMNRLQFSTKYSF